MDALKVGLGVFLLGVSTLLVLASGTVSSPVPIVAGGFGALAIAVVALLVGATSGVGRPA